MEIGGEGQEAGNSSLSHNESTPKGIDNKEGDE